MRQHSNKFMRWFSHSNWPIEWWPSAILWILVKKQWTGCQSEVAVHAYSTHFQGYQTFDCLWTIPDFF